MVAFGCSLRVVSSPVRDRFLFLNLAVWNGVSEKYVQKYMGGVSRSERKAMVHVTL